MGQCGSSFESSLVQHGRHHESAARGVGQKVLFITYNGLLDPLGSSQILPYITLIAKQPQHVHVLSFEKFAPESDEALELRAHLNAQDIGWTALAFSRRFGKLGKAWDLLKMYVTATRLASKQGFDVVHCRSLHAAQVGLAVRSIFGGKVIFDMRGLWVDERVDGGIWKLDRRLDSLIFGAYKRIERWVMRRSDRIVVLTNRVIEEVERIVPGSRSKITVIPCCADYSHFGVSSPADRVKYRKELGLGPGALVVSYLGSLGTWYRFSDMIALFQEVMRRHDEAYFLVITKDWTREREYELVDAGFTGNLRSRIVVRSATRQEVPAMLGASDIMLSFIDASYSKLASSPTKLAEAFASGVPVISNPGVGDVASITREFDAGALIELGDSASMAAIADGIQDIVGKGGEGLRSRTIGSFDLSRAAAGYRSLYESLSQTW